MDLSRKWLNEFVQVGINDKEFSEAMTLSGSKVELFKDLGAEINNVTVGKVLEITRHANSDHMWVCQIDVGESEPVQIVTGAQNVKMGDYVPVAKHNSTLPGGIKIEKGELRGEISCGMLCSLKELGLTLNDFPYAIEDGIFIIQEEGIKPGDDIKPIIGADDHVVEFEITSNRPDCLSVIGLAREAAVTFDKELKLHTPVIEEKADGILDDFLRVEVLDKILCPRYTARMIKNVKIAPSPRWMRERLRSSGVRPINNIVDITNYVMLEYGQPMHAFDYRYVKGGKIIVRRAEECENLTTLDGNVRKLTNNMLVIADDTRAVGLAGIMGGENSEIASDTVDVVFESANFNGTSIRKTALALGMRTEASAKFEKGLDIQNTVPAVDRACELVEMIGAGEVIRGMVDIVGEIPAATTLALRPNKINALLGTDIPTDEMCSILQDLGFKVDEQHNVTVPSWRGDVEHYSDLAEEVARIHGYNEIPTTLMRGTTTLGGYSPVQKMEGILGETCRTLGYNEIITYSFISPDYYDNIRIPEDSPLRRSMKIMNPLGEDTSIMRTTILPSMLEILSRNYNFRNKSAKLYELGSIYFEREDGLADEPRILSLGAYGADTDFFAIKSVVDAVVKSVRAKDVKYIAQSDNPSYHPGRCAEVYAGDKFLGVLGQVHPLVAKNYGVDSDLYAAELAFDALWECRGDTPVYTALPRYPAVTRDIAVVCDASIPAADLEDTITKFGGEYLRGCILFDVYQGSHIPAGKKSVAFSLTLRADNMTLTDDHAEETVDSILDGLKKIHGAVIR